MITERAVVTRCEGGQTEIMLRRASTCGDCELSQGCGTGALGKLLGNRSRPLLIETQQDLKPGDDLVLAISETALVRASLTVYGLPLLAMVSAGLLAAVLDLGEAWVTLASIVGFFAGYKFASRLTKKLEADRLTPYIVDIRVNRAPVPES